MAYRLLPRLFLLLVLASSLTAFADERGEGPLVPDQPKGISVDELVQKFAAKEKEFK